MRAGWPAAIACLALTACSGGSTASTQGALSGVPRGGTLRVVDFLYDPAEPDATWVDPVVNYDPGVAELFRCCLARTLLSFTGQPTDKGGADLKPDLATGMPEVSADGLTWTFHIRTGVHYAPPLQHTEIAAADFVRSLERLARLYGAGAPFFSVIRGFDDFATGKTSSIAGLETPDVHTLVVRLTEPAGGDLGYRFAASFAFPVPALPADPTALYGVASGHDAGDGSFLVSSGPYMVEGSEALDFGRPPAQQRPAAGLVPGRSLTLVRNPSWHAADDALRSAYVDRIVVTWATVANAAAAVDHGRADLALPALNALPPLDQIHAYQADPHKGRVEVQVEDAQLYLTMNVAVPPFDDVHVRRAVAYAVDRQAALAGLGGSLHGSVIGHVAADSMEDNALLTFDPYRTKGSAARIAAAKGEMALSRYDTNHDGICDLPVCQHIGALGDAGPDDPRKALEETIAPALSSVGLMVDMHTLKPDDFYKQFADPTSKTAMGAGYEVGMAYPSGSYVFTQQFADAAIGNQDNYSLVGATPDQLRSWGYSVTTVPSLEDRIAQCTPLIGAAATRCWTVLDQYVVEDVVAEVPLIALSDVVVIPSRVVSYSYDQSQDEPALDRVAVQH